MKTPQDGLRWPRTGPTFLGAIVLGVALSLALLMVCLASPASQAAPPIPTLLSPSDGLWTNQSSVAFSWSDVGAPTYNLRVGGQVYTTPATSMGLPLANGSYNWTVQSRNLDGEVSGYTDTWTVNVDRVPPVVSISTPASGAVLTTTHLPAVTIAGTAVDDGAGLARVEVYTNAGGQPASGTDTWTYDWPTPCRPS